MDGYSRFVAFFRVFLPLAALGLLSSLFLLSRSVDTDPAIPFADKDLLERTRTQLVARPVYMGLTRDGDEITVNAQRATPASGDEPAKAVDISALLKTGGRTDVTLVSDRGRFDQDANVATFIENVVIQSTNGYTILTEELVSSMERIEAHTPGEVHGFGPIGELTAGQMRVEPHENGEDLLLFFTNGVHLIYDPETGNR